MFLAFRGLIFIVFSLDEKERGKCKKKTTTRTTRKLTMNMQQFILYHHHNRTQIYSKYLSSLMYLLFLIHSAKSVVKLSSTAYYAETISVEAAIVVSSIPRIKYQSRPNEFTVLNLWFVFELAKEQTHQKQSEPICDFFWEKQTQKSHRWCE